MQRRWLSPPAQLLRDWLQDTVVCCHQFRFGLSGG